MHHLPDESTVGREPYASVRAGRARNVDKLPVRKAIGLFGSAAVKRLRPSCKSGSRGRIAIEAALTIRMVLSDVTAAPIE